MGRGLLQIDTEALLGWRGCPPGTRLLGVRSAPDTFLRGRGIIEIVVQHADLPFVEDGLLPPTVEIVTACEPGGEPTTTWSVE